MSPCRSRLNTKPTGLLACFYCGNIIDEPLSRNLVVALHICCPQLDFWSCGQATVEKTRPVLKLMGFDAIVARYFDEAQAKKCLETEPKLASRARLQVLVRDRICAVYINDLTERPQHSRSNTLFDSSSHHRSMHIFCHRRLVGCGFADK